MIKSNRREKNLKMIQLALLSALVVIVQIYFAAVRVGPVNLNFSLVPIVIAGIFIGPIGGLTVGVISGVTTIIQVFTAGDVFNVLLVSHNAIATAVICVLKAGLAGLLSGLSYKFMQKFTKNAAINAILPSIICPLANTTIFCLGMLIFFQKGFENDPNFAISPDNFVYFIIVTVALVNFLFELLTTLIVSPLVTKALSSTKMFK